MALRVLFILICLAAWFLPLIIATLYKLPHQGAIAVLSLLLGWTGAGWLAALVIAVGGAIRATRPPVAGQEQPPGPSVPAPAYAPAAREPARAPERAPAPGRAQPAPWPQPPQPAPSPERTQLPPAWPDSPR
jgi:hypothetical protein